jgi:hypothetical protein
MDGIDAAYEYAGIVGIRPHGMTLRQLWRMACGAMKQKRLESLQLVCLAFNDSVDTQKFLDCGVVAESNIGKPLTLSPELEAKVQAEIERIRRENPDLPPVAAIR